MRILLKSLISIIALALLLFVGLNLVLHVFSLTPPETDNTQTSFHIIEEVNGWRVSGKNCYRQNTLGIWEAYIEGAPYQRGLILGELAKQQVQEQEEHFIAQIRRLVPSELLLRTLKYGVSFFNRNMNDHVPLEYRQEILGISTSFDPIHNWISAPYARVMNYHAAHDIGHALQDLSIVGCTSFAAWDAASADSSLIIGRNFDFYMGDDFAKDKLVLFVRPDSGYAFASVTWAGFMGVVSGMNEHGLTVTLNAAKSAVPTGSKTPISILAREILQYARTIDEAYAIAQRRETFVSESILIGSAADGRAAIIEKDPNGIGLFAPDSHQLVCANHYQSETFRTSAVNVENIRMSDSEYRFRRMGQLMAAALPITPAIAADMLRNQEGIDGADLGMGNPKAINQLLAHHGIIFQPEKRLMWVSANPFQLGAFVCYDLNEVFGSHGKQSLAKGKEAFKIQGRHDGATTSNAPLTIAADTFLLTSAYQNFLSFKQFKQRIFDFLVFGRGSDLSLVEEQAFLASNPKSYLTHQLLGELYLHRDERAKAVAYFKQALALEVASETERNWLRAKIADGR